MTFRLEAQESIAVGMRRLLLEKVNQIEADLANPETASAESIHETRKNCKRIRAAYRLIRDEIGEELYHQENIRFRDLARLLAGARDDLVMVQTLDKFIAENSPGLPQSAFAGTRQELVARYETTLARSFQQQNVIAEMLESMRAAAYQIERLPIQNQDFVALRGGLHRTYRRGQLGMRVAYRQPRPANFHEWRKRVKYLWHQIEILEALRPDVLLPLVDDLHRLADYLGDDHDLAVLRQIVSEMPAHFRDQQEQVLLLQWIDQQRLRLETLARSLGERLYSDTPETFVQRLETYWQDWQAYTT